MLLASFSRLALVGATMFSLIGAIDPGSGSDTDNNLVEKKNSYDRSLQGSQSNSTSFINVNYKVSHLLVYLGWVDFDLKFHHLG